MRCECPLVWQKLSLPLENSKLEAAAQWCMLECKNARMHLAVTRSSYCHCRLVRMREAVSCATVKDYLLLAIPLA